MRNATLYAELRIFKVLWGYGDFLKSSHKYYNLCSFHLIER